MQENIVKQLKAECALLGTNLTTVCRAANVSRQTLVKWEQEEPRSFQILAALKEVLAGIRKEQETVHAEALSVSE